jgi:hypothetical protein
MMEKQHFFNFCVHFRTKTNVRYENAHAFDDKTLQIPSYVNIHYELAFRVPGLVCFVVD